MKFFLLSICMGMLQTSLRSQQQATVQQWTSYELSFYSGSKYANPYTDAEVWAWFVNDRGDSLLRPAFWYGDNCWKIRFTPPDKGRVWQWQSYASVADSGLAGKKGQIISVAYKGNNPLAKHGLLRMSAGKRNIVHADGTPRLLVGDTPWSLPYRATVDQVKIYAANRSRKGYNTALLIAVQPDKLAQGPSLRNTKDGFDRGFHDIPQGHMNQLNPVYFQTLDSLIAVLYEYAIAPVFAPLAHGYGWKGLQSLGPSVSGDEYARFCRYLVARYGDRPACWLISLDGNGMAPGVVPAGEMIEKWDAYRQPLGIHYNPCDDFLATWATSDSSHCFHYNRKHQQEPWLDFQWAQTGHDGKHLYHKVQRMYDNLPVKAVMNGEPTYEKMEEGLHGLGWWQGEDSWNQLMHGGTMGVIYGAACLWQWKITADEEGWESWTNAPYNWQEALHFEGSRYTGAIASAFEGYDFSDMERRWDLAGNQPLLAKEKIFYISYLEHGGSITIKDVPAHLSFQWFDPVKGKQGKLKKTGSAKTFSAPDSKQAWVLIIGNKKSASSRKL